MLSADEQNADAGWDDDDLDHEPVPDPRESLHNLLGSIEVEGEPASDLQHGAKPVAPRVLAFGGNLCNTF